MEEVYCPKCNYKYSTFLRIYRHTDKNSEKYYFCDNCEKRFQIVETSNNYKILKKTITTPSTYL